jgi:hypothetical protein
MTEFIFKKSDYTHPDPDEDRRGVHKMTDFINHKPDGWRDHPNWAASSYPKDFIVIACPEIPYAEARASDHRKSWRDDFDYQIVATRPAQGEYDIRVFEKNAGAIGQNHIAGVKATKVRDYMAAWGCSNFALTATDASFTFSLWNAVRSPNFWDVPLFGTKVTFVLNSYSGATGIGNITVAVNQAAWLPMQKVDPATQLLRDMTQEEIEVQIGDQITRKIAEKGGTVISQVYPNFVFEIERSDILTRFRADVKRRMEQVYTRHQYCISQADHDAIVAAGGVVTWTRAEFLSKLIDKMAG